MNVDINGLTVRYRDGGHALLALDTVDIGLRPGRVTALVGESGSGKTTLGKAVMGLLPPKAEIEGSIRLGSEQIVGLDEPSMNKLRWSRAAMVFQSGASNLNPVYRLVDQVAEPLIQQCGFDQKTAYQAAQKRLEEMGLSAEHGRRYPHELSGGQVQRALLAMALILDPEVLILDEPTAALDAMTKMFISGVIGNLREKRKSILLITHDLDLARNLADDLVVIYLGKIMEVMPGKDLLAAPRHPYTLALGKSYPGMDAVRDLGGIRGDAFYRVVHAHDRENEDGHSHSHVIAPNIEHEGGHAPAEGCLFYPRCTQAQDNCRHGDIRLTVSGGHRVRCIRGGIASLLELKGIEKSYGPVVALGSTNLTLRAGEVFCLVGETGSGKTTLAMIAAGGLKPDRGRRVFAGRDMDDWIKRDYRSLAPQIGVIHQSPVEAVSHRFSVFDIVAEPLRIQNGYFAKTQVHDRVLEALSDVRLPTDPEFLKSYPHELNMGAVQRLCLARALVHDPVLLIADEPTSSLDASVQAKILKMLLGLQIEKGLTMLFVTHDIGLARKIGDRIGVMLAGRMVEIGPASLILYQPCHPYTRMLIDCARGAASVPACSEKAEDHEVDTCPFLDRCGCFSDLCRFDAPKWFNVDGGQHRVWCHNPRVEGDVSLRKKDGKTSLPGMEYRDNKQ